jgi:hypothetical protein
MLIIAFCFLGIAGLVTAALFCLSAGKRAGQYVEVDYDALRAASACISGGRRAADGPATTRDDEPTWDAKAKWQEMKTMWMQCYAQCQEKAILKQKTMYSWARTLALGAVLCVVGVVLESVFDEPITAERILAGFRHSHPAATNHQGSQLEGKVAKTNLRK